MLPALSTPDKLLIGNDAGWHLAFCTDENLDGKPDLEFGRSDFYASVRAVLPGGLEGGTYRFVIEGLVDEQYQKLKQLYHPHALNVKLYLYWRDTNADLAGYAANVAGLTDLLSRSTARDLESKNPDSLVAVLRVTEISRKAGERRYETTIVARERIYDIVSTRRLHNAIEQDSMGFALKSLMQDAGLENKYAFYGRTPNAACSPPPPGTPADDHRSLRTGVPILQHLTTLGGSMEESSGSYGRGMFLQRKGYLYIGTRPIPFNDEPKDPKPLTLQTGFVEVSAMESVVSDPDFDTTSGDEPPKRKQFQVVLKGRPDLKPGQLVKVVLPDEDQDTQTGSDFLGALGDTISSVLPVLGDDMSKATTLYVSSVEHQLSRSSGFVTTITGVVVDQAAIWDCHTRHTEESSASATPTPRAADHATQVAHEMRRIAQAVNEAHRFPEIAEVRQVTPQGDTPPAQTLKLWRGMQPRDGAHHAARTLPIQRPSPAPTSTAPYLTPFAWGKCGLILPRFPGMRVMVEHVNSREDDAVDVGALWTSDNLPDQAQLGDWWLSLPATTVQGSLDDNNTGTPDAYSDKVSQDLIDASGNRVIEVGALTIRISTDGLPNAGTRPDAPAANTVTIEHTQKHSRIVIDADGNIEIHSGADLTLHADGDIKLDAQNVKVQVQNSMDVQ